MSYCYDTMTKAYATLRQHLPPEIRDGDLAVRFDFLISEMHEANHRLNDAINKDARVTKYARKLDELMGVGDGENI